jgi:hypothetical protein
MFLAAWDASDWSGVAAVVFALWFFGKWFDQGGGPMPPNDDEWLPWHDRGPGPG